MKRRNKRNRNIPLLFFFASILLLLIVVASYEVASRLNPKLAIANPFKHTTIVNPIPQHTPQDAIAKLLATNKIPFSSIDEKVASDSSYYQVMLPEDTEVLVDTNSDLGKQIMSLQIIKTRLTIEGKKAKRIDVRFSEPIVVY